MARKLVPMLSILCACPAPLAIVDAGPGVRPFFTAVSGSASFEQAGGGAGFSAVLVSSGFGYCEQIDLAPGTFNACMTTDEDGSFGRMSVWFDDDDPESFEVASDFQFGPELVGFSGCAITGAVCAHLQVLLRGEPLDIKFVEHDLGIGELSHPSRIPVPLQLAHLEEAQ